MFHLKLYQSIIPVLRERKIKCQADLNSITDVA